MSDKKLANKKIFSIKFFFDVAMVTNVEMFIFMLFGVVAVESTTKADKLEIIRKYLMESAGDEIITEKEKIDAIMNYLHGALP